MSVFQQIPEDRILYRSISYFIVKDSYPVSPGHLLIISNEAKVDYFDLSMDEKNELNELVLKAKEIIEEEYSPDGYNIGVNCGEVAGQSVMHFHCHVIPRYHGDMEDPKGGIRHCVEGKGYY